MKKCFICGRDYDETNRKHAADVTLRGKKASIKSISYKGRILALCHYCVKAFIIGAFRETYEGQMKYEDEYSDEFEKNFDQSVPKSFAYCYEIKEIPENSTEIDCVDIRET